MSDLPFTTPGPDPTRPEREPRKCRRHEWVTVKEQVAHLTIAETSCTRCGHRRDAARSKAGRNNRARGNRAELAVARRYGGEKVGPLGGPEDVRGRMFRVQVKTHQAEPPARWKGIFAALDTQHDGRTPVLLLRYLPGQGIPAEDFFIVRGADWLALHGRDE